ncbi:hypothetical protein [Clostridium polynesiense]|uniref:hypothetical protein n=1 Tax=Clostridium polynesiense TaxID=1325933 RepID=UPI000693CC16|nr:hypothetical protein [Clostridium polynesiense]
MEDNFIIKNTLFNKKNCYFCTLASNEYTLKVLALYSSLKEHCPSFHFWICCMDDEIFTSIKGLELEDITLFKVKEIETSEILKVKQSRMKNEYCWTLKPFIIKYLLDKFNLEALIYMDGDIFFFSDPTETFNYLKNHSVLLCPQRDLEWAHNIYGYYQAGFIGFKNDEYGLAALNWWKDKCLEWCFIKADPEHQRFGDQKYLDRIPELFKGVLISKNLGLDAAPWNCIYNNNYNIYQRNNELYIEDFKLLCFHFACISIFNEEEYDLWTFDYIPMKDIVKEKIYSHYISRLQRVLQYLRDYSKINVSSLFSTSSPKNAKTYFKLEAKNVTSDNAFNDNYKVKSPLVEISIPAEILPKDVSNTRPKASAYSFCSIVNEYNLPKFLALYKSLQAHASGFHIWICALDEYIFNILNDMHLKNCTIIPSSHIENNHVIRAKSSRNLLEYSWTLKPVFIEYLIENHGVDSLIYCDADIFLYSSPEDLIEEWKGHSVFMCRQRRDYEEEKMYGGFQSSLIGFKNTINSLSIIKWWKEKCLKWCYAMPDIENKLFSDQRYLDEIPLLFSDIKLIEHPGINSAPWNINKKNIYYNNGEIYIDGVRLISYNFENLKILSPTEFDLYSSPSVKLSEKDIKNLYGPYIKEIQKVLTSLQESHSSLIYQLYKDRSQTSSINYFKSN